MGSGVVFYVIQMITLVLLVLAANTSFGGLPVLASLVAKDNFLPHVFHLKAERQVHRYGVVRARGRGRGAAGRVAGQHAGAHPAVRHRGVRRVHAVPDRHGPALACRTAQPGWARRAAINGLGAVLTFLAIVIELVSKFTEGAWVVVLVIPLLIVIFLGVHRAYDRIGACCWGSGRCRRRRTGRSRWSWCPSPGCRG